MDDGDDIIILIYYLFERLANVRYSPTFDNKEPANDTDDGDDNGDSGDDQQCVIDQSLIIGDLNG